LVPIISVVGAVAIRRGACPRNVTLGDTTERTVDHPPIKQQLRL
jgi:hypothetical protein